MAQNITPELLQLRARDHDMHRALKVALQPWPTLAGLKALTDFGLWGNVHDSYFRADSFCNYHHGMTMRRPARSLGRLLLTVLQKREVAK